MSLPPHTAPLVLLSARTLGSLRSIATWLSNHLEDEAALPEGPLHATQGEGPHRAVIVGADRAALREGLQALACGDPDPGVVTGVVGAQPPRVGFLLTGEGSERAQAGASLVSTDAAFAEAVQGAFEVIGRPEMASMKVDLPQWRDLHLSKVLLGALDLGLAAALRARGVVPTAVCGHSLGEYVAAALAGSISAQDMMRLLYDQGQRNVDYHVRGGLALVQGPGARVSALLAGHTDIGLAADNTADWCAIWGTPDGLERARGLLRAEGLSARKLPVYLPMHGPLLASLAEGAVEFARSFAHSSPKCTWVSTMSAAPVQDLDARYWGQAMTQTVRFREAWAVARALPVDLWVELGPKPTLSLFVEEDGPVLSALDPKLDDRLAFTRLLGWLWCYGHPLDWAAQELSPPAALLETTAAPPTPASQLAAALSGLSEAERQALLELPLREEAAAVLGLSPEAVAVEQPLSALGLDSLMAVELRDRLSERLGSRMSLREMLSGASVRTLAQSIKKTLVGDTDGGPSLLTTSEIAAQPSLHPVEHPASYGQQRLAFLHETLPPETYKVQAAFTLGRDLRADLLREALGRLITRHEQLRVALILRDGTTIQRVMPTMEVPLRVYDWRQLEGEDERLRALVAEQAREPFALDKAPLLRLTLVQLPNTRSALLLLWHHAVTDGQSTSIFFQELSQAYEALEQGRPFDAPATASYARFSALRRQWVEQADEARRWWKQHLSGVQRLELPTDRPPPPTASGRGRELDFVLPLELSEALDTLARQRALTPFVVLLTAWASLLHRLSNTAQLPIVFITSGRPRADLADVIGLFVRTLPAHITVAPTDTAAALMSRVRATTLEVMEHELLPLLEILSLAPPDSRDGLLRVSFVLESEEWELNSFAGTPTAPLTKSWSGDVDGTTKFDLALAMVRGPQGYRASLQYSVDLFDAETIQRWAGYLENLLRGIVERPEHRLSELPMMGEAERQQVLQTWNNSAAPTPTLPIHALFEQQVQRRPDAPALVFEQDTLSYAQLNTRARQLAWRLRGLGVGPEVRVGLGLPRSVELVVALLAVLKAGGAYVPLDPSYPEARLRFMAEDAGVTVLISRSALDFPLPEGVRRLDMDLMDLSEPPRQELPFTGTLDSLAYVIYTSGSTGKAKGVAVPHAGPVNVIAEEAVRLALREDSVVLHHASFGFDASVVQLFAPLSAGARVVLTSELERADMDALTARMQREGVEVADLPPATLPHLDLDRLGALRVLILGGEGCSPRVAARVAQGRRLLNTYGPTETSICCTRWEGDPTRCQGLSLPIGVPVQNMRLYVLDAGGAPTPVGAPGELHIAGLGLARGYLGRPGLTAERFVPDPFGPPGSRMYRSGDLARWRADGNLEFLGRIDQQVKLRGYRIELGEIETAVGALPDVSQCVVLLREDSPGEKRLVAYVVGDPGLDLKAMRASLRSTLPDWMVPSVFLRLDALPLTPNGKLDRQALPAPDHSLSARSVTPPRSETEVLLAQIWGEVLGLPQVGVEDRFFELGGDSIRALNVVSLATRAGLALTARDLFALPDLGALAAYLDGGRENSGAPSCLVRLRPGEGERPLLCFAPQGGAAHAFSHLARALRPGLPVWVMEAPELAGHPESPDTLTGLAELYVQELHALLPSQGAVRLLGYSFGGPVAVEVARLLRERGTTLSSLVMIDPPTPEALPIDEGPFDFLARHVGLVPEELAALPEEQAMQRISARLVEQGEAPAGEPVEQMMRRILGAARRNGARLATWRARAPTVPTTLFRAEKSEQDDRSWRELLGDTLKVQPIPGDHFSCVRDPLVEGLARKIEALLDAAPPSPGP